MANPENKQIPYESTQKDIRDAIESVATAIGGIAIPSADHVSYDNSGSGLSATDVQNALDEIVSDIPTVNDGTLTIQQNGETKGTFTANQSGNSTVNIETPTTDIQTAVDEFETYNGGLLSSLKVAFSPIQDLHGYDHPWVGGAGKNLLPPTKFPTNAFNGITSSVSGDVLTLSGITTNANGYYFGQPNEIISLKAGTYTMSFSATGSWGTNSLKEARLRKSDNTILLRLYDGSVNSGSITFNEDTDVFFAINGGANIPANENVNVSITVQLEAGSTATPYEPYENICPISGHTQVVVGDDGKNCLPNDATDQTVSGVEFKKNNDGSLTLNGQSTADWAGITLTSAKTLKAGTYTVSCPRVNSVDTRLIISYDGAEKVNTYNVDYKTFTLTEDKTISVRFVIRNSGVSFSNVTYYPMIEKGSIKTDYVPYNGYQVTVNLGGTYYSGTLDVVTGVFVPDTAGVDLGTLTWSKGSVTYYAGISGMKIQTNQSQKMNAYCSSYKISAQSEQEYNTISGLNWGANIAFWNLVDYSDANQVKTAMSGVQLVYELATPTPIQLTPQQVKALVGENHLSAPLEGQEITEVKYKKMFTFDDVIAYIQSLS